MAQPTKYGNIERWYTGTSDLPLKGPLPKGTTLNGTFSTNGKIVTGIGTKFSTDLGGVKGWLYSTQLNQLRPFVGYDSDTYLNLLSPFTVDVVNEPVVVCFINYTLVTIQSLGTNGGVVKERRFLAGSIETYPNDAGVEPITYDFTTDGVSGALMLLQH